MGQAYSDLFRKFKIANSEKRLVFLWAHREGADACYFGLDLRIYQPQHYIDLLRTEHHGPCHIEIPALASAACISRV